MEFINEEDNSTVLWIDNCTLIVSGKKEIGVIYRDCYGENFVILQKEFFKNFKRRK
jgi:hypothetical protein